MLQSKWTLCSAATLAVAAMSAGGCQNGASSRETAMDRPGQSTVVAEKYDASRDKWVMTGECDDDETRTVVRQTSVGSERPDLYRPEIAPHEHATGTDGMPDHIRAAALKEVPAGRIVSAEHYVTSDIDVFDVAVVAAGGLHVVKVRQDGVVLRDVLNPAREVAHQTSLDESPIAANRPNTDDE